ncbi:MAG: choice-of-anchor B family protein [Ignavibacteria bacterium]
MKNLILFTLICFLITLEAQTANSQAGKNVTMIGHKDPVGNNLVFTYSAIWGYEANGREYAIVGGINGTYFFDVTDSSNIVTVGNIPNGNLIMEMKTYSHYAYITSEALNFGVKIVDLQNLPNSVQLVNTYIPPEHVSTHTISQSGPYLYLNGSNPTFTQGIAVLDLSVDPVHPVLRGKWNELYSHDCRIVNDTIWSANIFDGKLTIINATDKDNLTTIRQWNNLPDPFPHNCVLTPDRNYIFTTDETALPPGRVKVWDIRDLEDITFKNIFTPQIFDKCIVHNVELHGNKLFAAYYEAGVKILDVSNPESPAELGWFDTYPEDNETTFNGCWGVYIFSSGKIIVSDRRHGLFVLRYTPPQNAPTKAELMASKPTAVRNDSITLIDCSSNTPTSFQWNVTGPQNFSSTLPNPKFQFTQLGYYNVSLRVSNSFGTDSVIKNNYIKINGSPLSTYSILGSSPLHFITSSSDTSRIIFTWFSASPGAEDVTYKFRLRKALVNTDYYYTSDNNGSETTATIRRSRLDSIARALGLTGDSITLLCKVVAYNGSDSLESINTIVVNVRSTTVGIQNISSEIPDRFDLGNNYPNPFNPFTSIDFGLPERSFVIFNLYDITGRLVRKLLNEEINAGYYKYRLDASALNSGVYFYSITAGQFSQTKKLVVLK